MPDTVEELSILADKSVWIIDDDIPIQLAKFEHDDLISGKRPIDRGCLLSLLIHEEWPDPSLKALCGELVLSAKDVCAFLEPVAALLHLQSGARVPDVVVYDLVYRTHAVGQGRTALDALQQILDGCVCVIQVYTQEGPDEIPGTLNDMCQRYDWRMGKPQQKAETDARALTELVAAQLQKSLSARLASTVRQSSARAIEQVLLKIDNLPVRVAVRLLASQAEWPEDAELVELISVKVSEVLESSQPLQSAVTEYMLRKGLTTDQAERAVKEAIALLVAHTRESVRDGGLFDQMRDAWEIAKMGMAAPDSEETKRIIQRFYSFRLYSRPMDDLVRTGDIVALGHKTAATPDPQELFLVLTPPCDLAKFWKKTRGSLTCTRMVPTDEKGLERLHSYGNRKFQAGNSITAVQPLVLPSVPMSETAYVDYVLYPHEVVVKSLEDKALSNAGPDNAGLGRSLRYSELGDVLIRKCRISEPFLAGILAEIERVLFRPGVPDYPKEEKKRIEGLIKPPA